MIDYSKIDNSKEFDERCIQYGINSRDFFNRLRNLPLEVQNELDNFVTPGKSPYDDFPLPDGETLKTSLEHIRVLIKLFLAIPKGHQENFYVGKSSRRTEKI